MDQYSYPPLSSGDVSMVGQKVREEGGEGNVMLSSLFLVTHYPYYDLTGKNTVLVSQNASQGTQLPKSNFLYQHASRPSYMYKSTGSMYGYHAC